MPTMKYLFLNAITTSKNRTCKRLLSGSKSSVSCFEINILTFIEKTRQISIYTKELFILDIHKQTLGASHFLCTADKQEVTMRLQYRSHPAGDMIPPYHQSSVSYWPLHVSGSWTRLLWLLTVDLILLPNIVFTFQTSFLFMSISICTRNLTKLD